MADENETPKNEEKAASNDSDEEAEDDSEGELIPKKKLINRLAQKDRVHKKQMDDLKKQFQAEMESVKKTAAIIATDNPQTEDTTTMDNMTAQQPVPQAPPQITTAPGVGIQTGAMPPVNSPAPMPASVDPMAQAAGAPPQVAPNPNDSLASLTPEQLQALNIKLQETQQNAQAAQQQEVMQQKVTATKQNIIKNIDTAMDNDPDFKQLFNDNAGRLPPQFFASAIDLLIGEDDAPAVFKKLISTQEGINSYINADPVDRTSLLNRLGKQVQAEKLGDMTPTAMTPFATRNTGKSAKAPEDMSAQEYGKFMKSKGMY